MLPMRPTNRLQPAIPKHGWRTKRRIKVSGPLPDATVDTPNRKKNNKENTNKISTNQKTTKKIKQKNIEIKGKS